MQFLDHTYIWDWCRTHGFSLEESEPINGVRLEEDASLIHRDRLVHDAADDSVAALLLAGDVRRVLGDWDDCLAWVTDSDVWVNEEDWPEHYRWRGEHGERRSLDSTPGHLFTVDDESDFMILASHAIKCGWDVTFLPAKGEVSTGVRVRCSHDEWIDVRSRESIAISAPEQPG